MTRSRLRSSKRTCGVSSLVAPAIAGGVEVITGYSRSLAVERPRYAVSTPAQ